MGHFQRLGLKRAPKRCSRKLTAYYVQNQRPPLTEAVFLTRLPRHLAHAKAFSQCLGRTSLSSSLADVRYLPQSCLVPLYPPADSCGLSLPRMCASMSIAHKHH